MKLTREEKKLLVACVVCCTELSGIGRLPKAFDRMGELKVLGGKIISSIKEEDMKGVGILEG